METQGDILFEYHLPSKGGGPDFTRTNEVLNRVQSEAEPPGLVFWFCWGGIIFICVFRPLQMMTAVVASSPFTLPLHPPCYYSFEYVVIWRELSCSLGLYVRTEASLSGHVLEALCCSHGHLILCPIIKVFYKLWLSLPLFVRLVQKALVCRALTFQLKRTLTLYFFCFY